MSSAAYITFEPDIVGISLEEWHAFCAERDIVHIPRVVGGNVYYLGEVECHYTSHCLQIRTYHLGAHMAAVALLAKRAWIRWGGNLEADPEIRGLFSKESL